MGVSSELVVMNGMDGMCVIWRVLRTFTTRLTKSHVHCAQAYIFSCLFHTEASRNDTLRFSTVHLKAPCCISSSQPESQADTRVLKFEYCHPVCHGSLRLVDE